METSRKELCAKDQQSRLKGEKRGVEDETDNRWKNVFTWTKLQ